MGTRKTRSLDGEMHAGSRKPCSRCPCTVINVLLSISTFAITHMNSKIGSVTSRVDGGCSRHRGRSDWTAIGPVADMTIVQPPGPDLDRTTSFVTTAMLVRSISISAMLASFHAVALPQCEVGQVREVTVPCVSGSMTFPPRIEYCLLPQTDGWVLGHANLGTQSLGGTGGSITTSPEAPISDERRQSISRFLVAELQASVDSNSEGRTAHLASLLQSVATGALPLHQASTVSVRVILQSWGTGFPPCTRGMTTSDCPHVTVPTVVVSLICLPSGR